MLRDYDLLALMRPFLIDVFTLCLKLRRIRRNYQYNKGNYLTWKLISYTSLPTCHEDDVWK